MFYLLELQSTLSKIKREMKSPERKNILEPRVINSNWLQEETRGWTGRLTSYNGIRDKSLRQFGNIIQSATKEIVLIDNYVDISILERLGKKQKDVHAVLYTDPKTKLKSLDVQKFNRQYPSLELKFTTKMHNSFLIIDGSILYHIGASLKDLGKNCFAFEVLDAALIPSILANL